MGKTFLSTNPFDVLLKIHQQGVKIDPHFSFWIRNFRDPPIRTVAALTVHCPRVDWLFWFLEQCANLELVSSNLVINAGIHVRYHLDAVENGRRYSAKNNSVMMPHTEGLAVLRDFLNRTLNNGG